MRSLYRESMLDTSFQPLPALPASLFDAHRRPPAAAVFRGLAAKWPAVRAWRFDELARRVPDREVRLVVGNREAAETRFERSTLRGYLESLHEGPGQADGARYLKEFDLLDAVPALRADLRHGELLPPSTVRSLRTWIGPAGARTGLHYDYLDNLAVQVIGSKRWWLARPGAVERLGAVSDKYDAWAVLSRLDARTLAERDGPSGDFFTVDLHPGDVLHVPAGWWHEVTNLSASLLFGGFHGTLGRVLPRWAWVGARDLLHRGGWLGGRNCTCHPPRPSAAGPRRRSSSA